MKLAATAAALLVGATAVAAQKCSTPEWGQCGKGDGSLSCCPSGFYCQPWDPSNFQCQRVPTQCSQQYTNVDFVGNDIQTIYSIQPGECCKRCSETKGCAAYTFVNYRPGPPACYLKRAAGKQTKLVGAVSGIVGSGRSDDSGDPNKTPSPPTPPANKCATNAWGRCGDEKKSFCCPTGQYCQPWNPGFYQCMKVPDACPKQLTDVDFPGNDIGKARAGTGDECCAACARDSRCKAYTFVNFNNDGPQCYLKSSAGDGKGTRKVGAVSGRR